MKQCSCLPILLGVMLTLTITAVAQETTSTAVYSRIGRDYTRERLKDGSFKPEYYALSNGGRIEGTTSDVTVDRVGYPEVAETAARLLERQNYRYAQNKEQAKLLIVLHWGSTIVPNGMNYSQSVNQVSQVLASLPPQGMGSFDADAEFSNTGMDAGGGLEGVMLMMMMENRVRDRINEGNARVLGYLDDINESNDIRRWAGGGDRYNDLIADVEESRYYIVISAYDFPELLKYEKKKLLWQTRVSVRAPGNGFDDSFAAMLRGASKFFGQDTGRLVRGEEIKGTVEFGDLKYLGEAREPTTKKARPLERN